jgi:hypothetical protein
MEEPLDACSRVVSAVAREPTPRVAALRVRQGPEPADRGKRDGWGSHGHCCSGPSIATGA